MSSTQVVGLLVWSKTAQILVQYGRIWSHKWSTKVKNDTSPEMTQKGLEMVPIASGSPGNRFLYYNNVFLYHKMEPFCSYYLLPLFPC